MEAIEGSRVNGAKAVVYEDAAEQEWQHKLENCKKSFVNIRTMIDTMIFTDKLNLCN